jgi:hypothetical protein
MNEDMLRGIRIGLEAAVKVIEAGTRIFISPSLAIGRLPESNIIAAIRALALDPAKILEQAENEEKND